MYGPLDEKEVARYMGYRKGAPDETMQKAIKAGIEQLSQQLRPKRIYGHFTLQKKQDSIGVVGTDLLLTGKSIQKYLEGANSCFLLAATLGIEADRLIDIAGHIDMTDALVLEACCNAYIEAVCDSAQAEIESDWGGDTVFKGRFSPGYGDFPLDVTPMLLSILQATKTIGLTVTKHLLMIPRKSVTAIIGVYDAKSTKGGHLCEAACNRCTMQNVCQFSKI